MGYFRIMAAIPGFFLSSLFFMLLWDVIAPKNRYGGYQLCYINANNHYSLDSNSTISSCGREEEIVTTRKL